MARTPSNMMPLGTVAPYFNLYDTASGKNMQIDECIKEKGLLVMFICNHCPFVVHVIDELISIGNDYLPKGIGMVAISSNDVENYPDDSPEKMRDLAKLKDFPFPYMYDETQEIAKAYNAACTPDIFLFDKDKKCVYRGQIDNSRPGNDIPVTGKDLRDALENLISGKAINEIQYPGIGCNIKWK